MSDIVERLLTRKDYADREEAADLIERLREALRQMNAYPMACAARQILYSALSDPPALADKP